MENELPIIKHIVLSGGGQSIFTFYGVIKESNERGLWNISNIESIYGTSAGAILSTEYPLIGSETKKTSSSSV